MIIQILKLAKLQQVFSLNIYLPKSLIEAEIIFLQIYPYAFFKTPQANYYANNESA